LILILGLLVPALIAVGCGGDDDETTPAKPAELVAIEGALLSKLVNQTGPRRWTARQTPTSSSRRSSPAV
jgi:hypothetical protein